jgi:hypothetical protein
MGVGPAVDVEKPPTYGRTTMHGDVLQRHQGGPGMRKTTSLRLPEDLRERITAAAEQQGTTLTALVERWLLQVQDGLEGEVDAPLFLDGEVALVVTEPAHVDRAGLFHQHSSR